MRPAQLMSRRGRGRCGDRAGCGWRWNRRRFRWCLLVHFRRLHGVGRAPRAVGVADVLLCGACSVGPRWSRDGDFGVRDRLLRCQRCGRRWCGALRRNGLVGLLDAARGCRDFLAERGVDRFLHGRGQLDVGFFDSDLFDFRGARFGDLDLVGLRGFGSRGDVRHGFLHLRGHVRQPFRLGRRDAGAEQPGTGRDARGGDGPRGAGAQAGPVPAPRAATGHLHHRQFPAACFLAACSSTAVVPAARPRSRRTAFSGRPVWRPEPGTSGINGPPLQDGREPTPVSTTRTGGLLKPFAAQITRVPRREPRRLPLRCVPSGRTR